MPTWILGKILADGYSADLELITEDSFVIRNTAGEEIEDAPLDAIFSEDDSGVVGDDSDSDGFLSEVWIIFYYQSSC